MRCRSLCWKLALLGSLLLLPTIIYAQGTQADYERANNLRNRFQNLAVNIPEAPNWVEGTSRFWYRKSVKGGNEFVLVDAEATTKKPAFDHERLAVALSAAANQKYTAVSLPFNSIKFIDGERAIEFTADGSTWRCNLSDYTVKKTGSAPQQGPPGQRGRRGGDPAPFDDDEEPPSEFANDVFDGMVDLSPQQGQQQGQRGGGQGQRQGGPGPAGQAQDETVKASHDGKWEAFIQNFNVFIRPKGQPRNSTQISWDGSEGNYYTFQSIAWARDSKHLVAYRVRPGYRREVHYVESSPTDQLQPKHTTNVYAKPGDTLNIAQPMLFDVETKKQLVVDNTLFPNPYSLSNPVWWEDSRGFTFEYNQRGVGSPGTELEFAL